MTFQAINDELWRSYLDAENRLVACRMALVRDRRALEESVALALTDPAQRSVALRLLLSLPAEMSRAHLKQLVRLAAVGHRDVAACRELVRKLPDAISEIAETANEVLEEGGEEEYRRIAELYSGFAETLLGAHLNRCSAHPDADIREIAADFSVRPREA